MAIHHLRPGPGDLARLPHAGPAPIRTIDSGDRVFYQTLDAAWGTGASLPMDRVLYGYETPNGVIYAACIGARQF
jgi:hypothetical protein